MKHEELLHRCFRCGWCKMPLNYTDFNCPSYLQYRFESFTAGGRMWLIRAWQQGEIPAGERLAQILFTCVTCKNCVQTCAMAGIREQLVDIFMAAKGELAERGLVPPPVRDYLKAMQTHGNPYKRPDAERARWAEGLDLPRYSGQAYLFYVGDEGAFDELGIGMARSVARLLGEAGVDFGILAEAETSDGNDVRAAGEETLARALAEKLTGKLNDLGVKKVVTLSPHAFNIMKTDYPAWGGAFVVKHWTQVISRRLRALAPAGTALKVAFHDPCYLGRWQGEYEAPRALLKAVPGLALLEMPRNRQNALCCGGGGGNFFTDILGHGGDQAARVRVREAVETGADVLAAACPLCLKMLDDAVKAEGLDDRLAVRDLATLLLAER
ncbi:MAG TPA: (Fe-S)-binding protein [Syntrophales bacterium]|nr:(Fe-S)-binding protein [Syntrophales bacterium]